MVTQEEKLWAAVKSRNREEAEKWIKEGANVNAKDPNPWIDASLTFSVEAADVDSRKQSILNTSLHYAVINQDKEMAALLLKYGADINRTNSFGRTPLFYSVEMGDVEMVQFLLNNKATVDYVDKFNTSLLQAHESLKGIPTDDMRSKVQEIDILLQAALKRELAALALNSAIESAAKRFHHFPGVNKNSSDAQSLEPEKSTDGYYP